MHVNTMTMIYYMDAAMNWKTTLKAQVAVLKEIAMDYPGKTIENVIVQLEARLK